MIIICLTNLFNPFYPLDYSKAQWNTLMVSNVTLFVEIPWTIGIAGHLDWREIMPVSQPNIDYNT